MPPTVVIAPQIRPRTHGCPRPVRLPSSDNASAKPMLMPAPNDAAIPTRKASQLFCAAMATQNSWDAFLVGMAASLGAGISMGFAEALSDDGSLTGRGHPWVRGLICGAMTTVGGIGHTLPFLIPGFQLALGVAMVVVLLELGVISWVRHRFMDMPVFSAAMQVGLGGALVR